MNIDFLIIIPEIARGSNNRAVLGNWRRAWYNESDMKHPYRLFAIVAVVALVFVAKPTVTAFFNELDGLKAMIASANVEPDDGIADLIAQLETEAPATFNDVSKSEWYYSFVASVVDWGIVSGYRSTDGVLTGVYGPGDQVTRAQMLKMALKAAQVDEAECRSTTEHPQAGGHWAFVYVACGETMQLRSLRGNPPLDEAISRGEVVGMIHDAFQITVPPLYSNFKDTVNHAYESDIAYANITGLVTGDTDANGNPVGTFGPDRKLNRAEAAKLIYQALRVYEEEVAATAQEEQRVTIVSKPGSFSPSIVTVKHGVPLTITFINSGEHSFVIQELGIEKSLVEFQETLSFTPGKIGTFPFVSTVAGDREAGMIGTLIVH